MVASDLKQLEQMLMKELRSAMSELKAEAKNDMDDGTKYFYSGGTPKMYSRTGALGKTPDTTGIKYSNNSASFDAYLKQNHKYTTGDNPTMMQVLNLANNGSPWTTSGGRLARPTVGRQGFWEYSENKIQKSLNDIMNRHFN